MILHLKELITIIKCTDPNWHKFGAMNGKERLSHLSVFINRNSVALGANSALIMNSFVFMFIGLTEFDKSLVIVNSLGIVWNE